MGAERAQGNGWVRIPASRGEQQPAQARPAPPQAPYGQAPYAQPPYGQAPHGQQPQAGYAQAPYQGAPYPQAPYDPSMIYLSLVKRWREAGRTLPGHPDEEWERLISQPCWPGR
ncbi:hypothetical protein [Streptomyces sp. NBC_00503]|uniref:hypothetical protein n=1 Tax=Streptomyces sp. NBC_00503 TaxID=2903659 RepID=UPI002E81DC92|nr:hypothetical protein [Streptomyces sp. NBC_00503]WUD81766.1 hypothetical protein OG490_15180 [Streptomyces sp. NBC_00503]